MTNKIRIFGSYLLIVVFFLAVPAAFAYEPLDKEQGQGAKHPAESPAQQEAGTAETGFDAGKMILEHVADSHQWHLWGHTSIPLPVIVKSNKGIEVFSSSRFGHEGEDVYQGKNYTYG